LLQFSLREMPTTPQASCKPLTALIAGFSHPLVASHLGS
jgi:hypothetical protein